MQREFRKKSSYAPSKSATGSNGSYRKDFDNKKSFGNSDNGRFRSNKGNTSTRRYSGEKSNSSTNRFSKSSNPSRRFGSNSRGNSNSRGGYNRGRRSSSRFASKPISYEKYVMKAVPVEETKEYLPEFKFKDFDLAGILKTNISKKNYTNPTQIQDKTIPHILEGNDVVGLAATGSGKTAAFLIPMINKVLKDSTQKVLIICPTRELAAQIQDELKQFSNNTKIRSVIVIGGASMNNQLFLLRKNPQFIIATPGRLQDLVERRAINLGQFNNVILDEVDRMLDMGFVHEIKDIISKLKSERQTLFFSATMSKEVESIANSLLKNPVRVEIENHVTAKSIDQDIIRVNGAKAKIEVLHDLLIQEDFGKVLIFSKTKRGAERLSNELHERGFKVDALHGDKSQFIRNKVITKFKKDDIKILVATDVAARGLDIPDITHVINYDEPATYEDYIHRIGRTGRVGKRGKALTFIDQIQ